MHWSCFKSAESQLQMFEVCVIWACFRNEKPARTVSWRLDNVQTTDSIVRDGERERGRERGPYWRVLNWDERGCAVIEARKLSCDSITLQHERRHTIVYKGAARLIDLPFRLVCPLRLKLPYV